jgi:formamidopyrimidine-DNA glycosylase
LVAGIGNVYRTEVLFQHQLDPLQPGCELRADQWVALWSDLVELINLGAFNDIFVSFVDSLLKCGSTAPTGVKSGKMRIATI